MDVRIDFRIQFLSGTLVYPSKKWMVVVAMMMMMVVVVVVMMTLSLRNGLCSAGLMLN